MGMIFHYREQETLLGRANPLAKLILLLAFCIAINGAPFSITLIATALLCVVMALLGIPLSSYARDLRFFLLMATLIFLFNGLPSRNWRASLTLSLQFLDVVLCAVIFSDTTDFWDLSCALAPVLDKVPLVHGWRVASSIQLTLMLVPLVFEATSQTRDAQQARRGFSQNPVKALATYATSVMETLLEKLEEVSDALDARLFDPDAERVRLPFKMRDIPLLLLGACLIALRCVW